MNVMHPLVEATIWALHDAFVNQHMSSYGVCLPDSFHLPYNLDDMKEVEVDGEVNLHEMARSILKHLVGDRLAYQAECGGVIVLGAEGFEFEGEGEEALFRLWRP